MAPTRDGPASALRPALPQLGAALALIAVFVAVLGIPLQAGSARGLSSGELATWIAGVYGVAGVLSVVLVLRHRQPLLLTGNVFVLLFVASLGDELSWAELVGASMLAGGAILLLGPLGLTHRLAGWLPAPIVFGLLAGAVLPFFRDLFTALGESSVVVGAVLAAYLLGRRLLEPRVPAILPALVAGVLVAWLAGAMGSGDALGSWPRPVLTAPAFTVRGILTATPVILVFVTLQANLPSLVYLREQGYEPPERTLTMISGLGTMVGSLLGPMGISLSLPATALVAGPDAGAPSLRHRASAIAGLASVLIALLAGSASELTRIVPPVLLSAVVGLAVVGVLSNALRVVAAGPLLLGPLFAFGIALSGLSLFGFGAFFWALAIGLGVSLLLEREQWRSLRGDDR